MSALVRWAAENRLLALLLAAIIVGVGAFSAARLPIDAVPDVTSTQVQIVTRAPQLSATEVETQVTQPIEREMAGTPRLKETRSITKFGISIVTLVFQDGTDVYFARSLVSERLPSVRDKVPESVGKPELGPIATALGEIYMFEVKASAPARSTEELRTIVEWQIAPSLRQVPGVIEVVTYGGAEKQYRVTLDPARMAAHRLSAAEVQKALTNDNALAGGGYLESDGEQILLRGDARFRGLEDIRQTVVRTDARGVTVKIGHLGEVDTGPAQRQGAMTRDGRGEIVGASVLMLKGQNSREVTSHVKEKLAEIAPRLPAGVTVDPFYDRTEFIESVLFTIGKNLGEGALIVLGCLLLTLGSVRAGLLVAGAIPFSMLAGFIGLSAIGYSGNVMSLGAVDFGIIVEGAVLTVEHAMAHGASIAERESRRRHIIDAMAEVARPALFVVVITLLVFLPLATLEDIEGKMFRPVVFSLSFMLLGAIVYALVVLPAIAPVFLRASATSVDPWFSRVAKRAYSPIVSWALGRPRQVIALSFAVAALMLGAGTRVGADFLPRIFEGTFAVDALRQPSSSLPSALALGKETEDALREIPEVESVINRIGRPEGAVDPAGPESSDVFVLLRPRSEWRPGLTPETLAEELSSTLERRVPATVNAVSQPIEMRVNDLVAGVRSDVAVKIYGEDLNAMAKVAEGIKHKIAKVPGATDFKMEIPVGQPAVEVTIDRDRTGRLGIAPKAVLDTLSMSRSGLDVGVVREGERVFPLRLRVGGESVNSAADLGRLPVATQQGALVPMSMLTRIEEQKTVIQVSREKMERRLVVQGNVRGRDLVGFVNEAKAEVDAMPLPPGVRVEWGGQFQNFNRAKSRLLALVPVALGVISLMLVMMFKRVSYMLVTVASLPFALGGGVLGLVVRGLPFSIPAGVGFIALAGVSVCTGIVMCGNLAAQPPDRPAKDRVRDAALASLRARLSTALIAAIGFVPAAIATGAGAEVQRPLATVVIFGLSVSMVVSLLALPAMLLLVTRQERGQWAETAAIPLPGTK